MTQDLGPVLLHPIAYWRFWLACLASLIIVGLAGNLWDIWSNRRWRRELIDTRLTGVEDQLREIKARLAELELRQRASGGDSAAAYAIGLLDWIKEKPDESYRWLHKVPSDACALHCPRDYEACWQNYCLQLGECGYLREHSHASDEEMANCEVCEFARHATLRFREKLRQSEEVARTGEPKDQA